MIKLERPVERGATLAVRREDLPEPDEDAYYVFQLVGLRVEEEGGRALGTVNEVQNRTCQRHARARLRPARCRSSSPACSTIDLEAGRIVVARGFADADE